MIGGTCHSLTAKKVVRLFGIAPFTHSSSRNQAKLHASFDQLTQAAASTHDLRTAAARGSCSSLVPKLLLGVKNTMNKARSQAGAWEREWKRGFGNEERASAPHHFTIVGIQTTAVSLILACWNASFSAFSADGRDVPF